MATQDPRIKQIKIRSGVVKRIGKEKQMYEQEVVDQEAKIEKMKEDNKDEHDIKKQVEVLQESRVMIPDCKRRLKQAFQELKTMIDNESDLAESEDVKTAHGILSEAELQLAN